MIEEILESENLSEAWKRVKRNKGASGIDGMTVEDFPAFAREHWPRIATAIREGGTLPVYGPLKVRGFGFIDSGCHLLVNLLPERRPEAAA